MHGLTISDLARDGTLAVGLEDILTTLGPDAERAWWKTTGLECLGPSAEKLYSLTDEGAFILGRSLVSLSRGLTQVIDGEFDAYRDGSKEPWVMVRAVDGTEFDVETDDEEVLCRIRERFRRVSDFPDELSSGRRPLPSLDR